MIPCATCGSRGLIKCETCQGGGSLLTRKVAVVRWYVLTRFKYIYSWSDNVVKIGLGARWPLSDMENIYLLAKLGIRD